MQVNDPVKSTDPSFPIAGFIEEIQLVGQAQMILIHGVSLISGESTGSFQVSRKNVVSDESPELLEAIKKNRATHARFEEANLSYKERYKKRVNELAEKHSINVDVVEDIIQAMNEFYWPG